MQTCTVNVHYLLHVADSIQYIGPVWTYWAFPMERFCSFVGASVKSRRYPWTNISRRIRDVAQLQVIENLYSLHGSLAFSKPKDTQDEDLHDAQTLPGCEFIWPYPCIYPDFCNRPSSTFIDASRNTARSDAPVAGEDRCLFSHSIWRPGARREDAYPQHSQTVGPSTDFCRRRSHSCTGISQAPLRWTRCFICTSKHQIYMYPASSSYCRISMCLW